MGFQPQGAGRDVRIDAGLAPPFRFIAAAVHFAMMAAAQRHGEFVADLAPERRGLREAQVVGIRGPAAADQARQFGQRSDVIAIAQAPRLRQRQPALVDHRSARPFLVAFDSWPVALGLRSASWSVSCSGTKVMQARAKRLLHLLGIGCRQSVLVGSVRCAHSAASSLEPRRRFGPAADRAIPLTPPVLAPGRRHPRSASAVGGGPSPRGGH